MNIEKLIKQLRIHEGVEYEVYTDTTGHRTVGIGFNLERMDAPTILESLGMDHHSVVTGGYRLNDGEVEALLQIDLDKLLVQIYDLIPNFDELNDVRQRVVVDMLFNLGYLGFKKFKNTRQYIINGDYSKAASNMLLSLWAKQVKGRATRLAEMMRYGEDVYDLD